MNIFQIAKTELKRMTSSRMRVMALIALITIPSLYSGLYLYANQDPYGNMSNVPVAVVVSENPETPIFLGDILDTTTDYMPNTTSDTMPIDSQSIESQIDAAYNTLGHQIAKALLDSKKFNMVITDYDDASIGVTSGKYLFAVNIGADFTKNINSISSAILTGELSKPAEITLITNDANSYLIHSAADETGNTITASIKAQVTSQITDTFLKSMSDLHDKMKVAANGATQINDGLTELNSKTPEYFEGLSQALNGSNELSENLNRLYQTVKDIPSLTKNLADGASAVADGNAQIATTANTIISHLNGSYSNWENQIKPQLQQLIDRISLSPELQQALAQILTDIDGTLTDLNTKANGLNLELAQLADGSSQVSKGATKLSESMPTLISGILELNKGASSLTDGLQVLSTSFTQIQDALIRLGDGSKLLSSNLDEGYKLIPNLTDNQRVEVVKTATSPVAISNNTQSSAGGYAQGLMPFFIALSAWVGAYALFILLKPLSNRALAARKNSIRIALGGWLTPALIGAFQMLLLFVIVVFGLHMPPANWAFAIGFMLLMSMAYTAVLFSIVAALEKVGTFLGLVLLILQLTSSGGTFPWQTTPFFFHPLHDLLPMGYAVDGLRHIFYGASLGPVWIDVLVLSVYLIVGLAMSAIIASKQRTWTMKRLLPEL